VNFNPELLHFAHHYGFTPRPAAYAAWVKGKVERPVDYIRESFCAATSSASLRPPIKTFANVGYGGQPAHPWHPPAADHRALATREARLGALPLTDYDTSLKVFRKVYKDAWYPTRPTATFCLTRWSQAVLLKVKNSTIHFFDDDRLLVSYAQAEGKHQLVGNPSFYEALKATGAEPTQVRPPQAKATRDCPSFALSTGDVPPLAEYESAVGAAQGGGL